MTKQELFNKYSINESHSAWNNKIDNWHSVEIYRIMHGGNLPDENNESIKWVTAFLDKTEDVKWWAKNVMTHKTWGSLYLTAKRMVYRYHEDILNHKEP